MNNEEDESVNNPTYKNIATKKRNDQNETVKIDVCSAMKVPYVEVAVSMHVDEETGRCYSYNEATGQTQWLSDEDE